MKWISIRDTLPKEVRCDKNGQLYWDKENKILFCDKNQECLVGVYVKDSNTIIDHDGEFIRAGFWAMIPYDDNLRYIKDVLYWAPIVPLPKDGE